MLSKFITVTLSFVIASLSFGQLNQTDSKGRKQGDWVKYFDNSKVVRFKAQFKNDKPIGKFVYYYPSKAVQAVIIHDETGPRSEAYMYSENKKLIAFGIYMNQEKDSIWTHYNENQELIFKESYKNGVLHGEKTIYFSLRDAGSKNKPAVLQTIPYQNGELHGTMIDYFPDGIVKRKTNYHNGEKHGKTEHFHPGGRLFIVERWKNNKRHGWWITYEESGKELGRKYYYDGEELEGEKLKTKLQELKEKGLNPNQ
jgi:antitoxin component YwqK of YwqJK toxin-antitoxin module